ncbi:hypothetical protein [Fluviicola sp.]|uniref:hypothetical protein n=1 Tax=Fluviicola sp. TaxID=1917219 RepID=UPI002833E35E|nr:hypothetical protein [Fluviicola sp.]MDR0802226.1 hypothetical protein [Fluviicola sp.]
MKYLRLNAFKKENPNLHFPLSEDQRRAFFKSCNKLFPETSEKEKFVFFELFSDSKKLIFVSWTEENRSLNNALEQCEFTELFSDTSQIGKHALFEEYKAFIEPFLYPLFTEKFNRISDKNIHFFMSYSVLLPAHQQNLVQDSLSEWIFRQKEALERMLGEARKDTDLHRQTDQFLSENLISALNLLNVNHYRVKTQLLEFFMSLAYHPKSSSRFLMYLSTKLLQVNYTAEHKKQLREFGADVKKGKIVVESTRVSWLRLSIIILLLVLCIGGMIALFFIDANPEENLAQEQTAYMFFSKEERIKLDSLITEAKSEHRMIQDAQLDSNIPFVGVDLTPKRNWNNELFQEIYRHWGNNDSVPFTKFFTKENGYIKSYIGTKDLGQKKGQIEAEFHNETDLMVLVIVFQNSRKEPVYTKYIHSGTVGEWKMNNGEHLVILPGSKVPSNPKFGNLPFKELDQHFYENLGISYHLDAFVGKRIKLVWENLGNNNSYLVDLSGALIKE